MWSRWARVAAVLVCASVTSAQYGGVFSNSYSMSVSTQGACISAQNGFTTADPRPYTYVMEPLSTEFNIPIPNSQGCRTVGVAVTVCERSASASVQLQDLEHAYVRRNGDVSTPGRADLVIYCG